MISIFKKYKKIGLIFIIFCILSKGAFAVEVKNPPHFNLLHTRNNIKVLKNTKRFHQFLIEDEKYLRDIDNVTLQNEIALFDQYMYDAKTSFKRTKQGAMLYSPNTVGNIVVCEAASKNRRNLLKAREENKRFKYQMGVFHYPKKTVRVNLANTIEPRKLKVAYEEIENVLDNIEFPDGVLEDTMISLSPFKIRGMNGFTETYGPKKEGTTLVLGIDTEYVDEDSRGFKEDVKSTLLHELGHSFHQQNTRKHKNDYDMTEDFWREYNEYYERDLNFDYKDIKTRHNWRTDIRENLAEDFRIYYSSRIGKDSFNPKPKKTITPYNPEVSEFFKKYGRTGLESEKVCMRHTTIDDNKLIYSLYDYSIREMENKDGLDIRIQSKEGQVCEGAYIGIWERGRKERSRRIPIKNKGDTVIHIDKTSDINIVIKYVKIRNEYKALWRLNIE